MIVYGLTFSASEKNELLGIFENHPKWRERVTGCAPALISDPMFAYQGCHDRGVCKTCDVVLVDTVCFCAGGDCPVCGNHIAPGLPKDFSGTYRQYYTNKFRPPFMAEYKNGVYEREASV